MARKPKLPTNSDATPARLMALISEWSEEETQQMRAAVLDLVRGVKVVLTVRKRGADRAGEEETRLENVAMNGELYEELYVYTRPPDPTWLRFVLEQNVGKAGVKEQARVDPILMVCHAVPGFEDMRPVDVAVEDSAPNLHPSDEPALGVVL